MSNITIYLLEVDKNRKEAVRVAENTSKRN
jgi:hypothetical protein